MIHGDIEAKIDDGSLIAESNENNNVTSISITIGSAGTQILTVTSSMSGSCTTGISVLPFGGRVDETGLTIVEPYPYTPTNKFSDIGWNKFPKFTAPTDGINIFNMAGANQAVEQGGTVMDWGWTHAANYDGRTAKVFGSHANKWTDPYKRLFE